MYIITGYKTTLKGLDINGARLYKISDEMSHLDNLLTFEQATAKGWKSQKAILVDFFCSENSVDFDGTVLEVSDEVGERLLAQYKDVKTKVYESADQAANRRNASAWATVASEYMHDPEDTHGWNGKASCNY